jgi:transposase
MAKGEEIPKANAKEIEALIERVRKYDIERRDAELIERLLRTVMMLLNLLERKNLSIRKLRAMIFGPRTEKRKGADPASEKNAEPAEEEKSGEPQTATRNEITAAINREEAVESVEKPRRKGHGRRPASAYSSAKVVSCRHENYKAGDHCPDPLCQGRLYNRNEPTMLLQFTGQPLITATKYEREVLRCSACLEQYVAPLPAGVEDERFDATADATIALMRYGGGMPWYRQSGLQAMCGVPLSESVMWERCEATADAALDIFLLLNRMAADGEVMQTDDTCVRILSCLKEDRRQKEGKGRATNTSGNVVKVGDRRIALYASGRRHAGENLAELLQMRSAGLDRPVQMSDALAANWIGQEKVIGAKCLAHGRRNVLDLAAIHPAECDVVLNALGKVYGYEAETKEMSKEERLGYHREKSRPVMRELKEWIEQQFRERLVEPNSNLGPALQYWLNHWSALTKFLEVPGAPLDNNEVERALKQFILMRKNSLFFKTEHGAAVGDILASLIMTCRLGGINAWEYLVTIMRHKKEARRNPHLYLPWNYKSDEASPRAA